MLSNLVAWISSTTWWSQASRNPSLDAKWCITSGAETPACSAIARIEVPATPCRPKRSMADSTMRRWALDGVGAALPGRLTMCSA